MKILRKVDWEYVLLEGDGGEPLIDVLCGTIAMFPRRVRLSPAEYARVLADEAYARELAISIRKEPSKFDGRYQDNPPHAFGES